MSLDSICNHRFFLIRKKLNLVVRQAMFDMYYPVQGLALYDTWMPTANYGNRFYDYNSQTADSHGIGAHLGNDFQMVMKNLYLANNTFFNTDREIQFGRCNSDLVGGPESFLTGTKII